MKPNAARIYSSLSHAGDLWVCHRCVKASYENVQHVSQELVHLNRLKFIHNVSNKTSFY